MNKRIITFCLFSISAFAPPKSRMAGTTFTPSRPLSEFAETFDTPRSFALASQRANTEMARASRTLGLSPVRVQNLTNPLDDPFDNLEDDPFSDCMLSDSITPVQENDAELNPPAAAIVRDDACDPARARSATSNKRATANATQTQANTAPAERLKLQDNTEPTARGRAKSDARLDLAAADLPSDFYQRRLGVTTTGSQKTTKKSRGFFGCLMVENSDVDENETTTNATANSAAATRLLSAAVPAAVSDPETAANNAAAATGLLSVPRLHAPSDAGTARMKSASQVRAVAQPADTRHGTPSSRTGAANKATAATVVKTAVTANTKTDKSSKKNVERSVSLFDLVASLLS